MIGLVSLFLGFSFLCLWLYFQRSRNLPPGPLPFPVFGNLPHFGIGVLRGKTVVQVMRDWKARFGPAMTVWLGPIPAVFVTDFDLAVDLFVRQGDAFVDRLKPPVFAATRKGLGIVMSEGDLWVEQRRFALHTLRNFGLGKNLMQEKILAEFHKQMAPVERALDAAGGEAKVDPKRTFSLLIGSIINSLLVGVTFDENNCQDFLVLKAKMDSLGNNLRLTDFFFGRIPLISKQKRQIKSGEYSLENGPQDFIDAYILEMERRTSNDMGYFSEEQLYASLLDMWAAGQETMIATLMWGTIMLVNHPEAQERMREEIVGVVGSERDVEESDRRSLPYTLATINEIQRIASIINFNFFVKSTRETSCGEYTLPSGTVAAIIMSVIFQDDVNFINPLEFKPSRFLEGEKGKQQMQKMIPFGLGKRACMGEGLARAELFLIMTNLIKNYRITSTAPDKRVPEAPVKLLSIFRRPQAFECLFQKVN
ncbi:hypothetical protein QR680_013358 [Steinernema hermaphroditum]|uniref:Uncharacterized protein n=1 Tax=Steinernema hermaphroditum TaxID=289476 RepID=A0AA39I7J9_9BILA|nr:hypothetical protein QR680_013358 [Steinernema hermaphroditum]